MWRRPEALEPSGMNVSGTQVLGPSTPGPLALVLDVPSAAFLPALLSHPTLQRCQAAGEPCCCALDVSAAALQVAAPVQTAHVRVLTCMTALVTLSSLAAQMGPARSSQPR